ncbi:hypothetical protein MNBD_CHLOROFLEXI01-4683 [hydrothermal vent metagenome]|uniref:DUF433 domain-containing protein n=1 Tax=hydrothermal vent metagenome TaxID=652676 RepID=A0A3B0V5H8_9ZZZZ
MLSFEIPILPLKTDSGGTIRIGGTRVRLDTVVYAFNQGYTAEEILSQFPALDLAGIYVVISYYLNNQEAIDEYIRQQEIEADHIQQQFESQPGYQAFRQRLHALKIEGK